MNETFVKSSDGVPLLVYHGSIAEFNAFDLSFSEEDGLEFGGGFYFSPKKSIAEGYAKGGYVYQCHLDIRNPFKTGVGLIHKEAFCGKNSNEIRESLIAQGYDGVVHVLWDGTIYEDSVFVAFYPEQVRILQIEALS